MRRILPGVILITMFLGLACAPEAKYKAMEAAYRELSVKAQGMQEQVAAAKAVPAEPAKAPPSPADALLRLTVVESRKVVYTGAFTLIVGDVAFAQERTKAMAQEMGGYMQQMTSDSIVIRVPAADFDRAIQQLGQIGSISDRTVSAQDVTEQYYDLEVRLKNAVALGTRLRELLKQAGAMKDALEGERELARVTTEIERLQGQIQRLKNQLDYATLTVTYHRLREAPAAEIAVKLPFAWLHALGLDSLLTFTQERTSP